jgi:predicted dehydrogenase
VHLLGLPEAVLASCSRLAVTQMGQSYDTEDTAVALMRYPKGVAGLIAASWLSQPREEVFCVHGSGGSATIDGQGLVVRDVGGEPVATASPEGGNPFVRQVEAAVAAAGGGASSAGAAGLPSVWEQLRTMAVIEAAYLSARTGHPESPGALLEVHGIRGGGERPSAASAPSRPDSEPSEA